MYFHFASILGLRVPHRVERDDLHLGVSKKIHLLVLRDYAEFMVWS